ncbi:MAG TPA: response regulator [Kofleriaceae bacterium]|nr:response regulator [Kofleriaceae bacterium]
MKTILVIEDDPLNLEILSDFLAHHGYRIRGATTGPEGIAQFHAEKPDLMLVDVQLPRKNGFEVCLEIKQSDRGRDTPVLIMSAVYGTDEYLQGYAARGLVPDGFLAKPFQFASLLDQVRGLIGEA